MKINRKVSVNHRPWNKLPLQRDLLPTFFPAEKIIKMTIRKPVEIYANLIRFEALENTQQWKYGITTRENINSALFIKLFK
jgi:hypothetical protein